MFQSTVFVHTPATLTLSKHNLTRIRRGKYARLIIRADAVRMDTLQFDEAVRVLKTACQTKTVLVDDVIRCLDIIDGSSTVPAKVKGKHCHQTHTAWEAGCFVAMVSDGQRRSESQRASSHTIFSLWFILLLFRFPHGRQWEVASGICRACTNPTMGVYSCHRRLCD